MTCVECNNNPQGVLLLDRYVPCKACAGRSTILSHAEFDKLKHDLWRLSKPRGYHTLPGMLVGGKGIAYKQVSNTPLGADQAGMNVRCCYEYVDERELEDGKHIFLHFEKSWTNMFGLFSKSMMSYEEIGFVREFETEEEAMKSIGPEATRN